MSPSPPELFPQRPIRSDFGRGPSYRTRRILTICVCLGLIGFILYRVFGGVSMTPGGIPTIKAEVGSWKQRPETPGGIDIPHQDVEVYQALDNKDTEAKPGVEHLLPPPETPQASAITPPPPIKTNPLPQASMIPQPENLAPKTTSIESIMGAPPPVATTVDPQPKPQPVERPLVQDVTPEPAPTPAVIPAVTPAPTLPKTKVEAPKPDAIEQVLKNATQSGKTARVQLAAVQDDEDSANTIMKQLQGKYASVLGKVRLHLERADLGDKGIFYRIQSQPVSDDQANDICSAIKNMKAGCLLVR